MSASRQLNQRHALGFILFMGVVSLFADMTYEGARSLTGPYLQHLGASALVVGMVAGLGESLGYLMRYVSGYYIDRRQQFWPTAFVGYSINLLAVPLLALAQHWWLAACLMVIERVGKGIRIPPRDAMLSYASQRVGLGWGFGLHEALDQAGAMLGPLLMAWCLYSSMSIAHSFAVLAVPALTALILLFFARRQYPNPQGLEETVQPLGTIHKRSYWLFVLAAACIALGYADFALIAYHFVKVGLLSMVWIPICYAAGLGSNMVMAPFLGYLYDRMGMMVLVGLTLVASFFAPLCFLGSPSVAFFGVIVWAIGYGTQASLMRAVIATLVPKDKCGGAYGTFNAIFGVAWMVGSMVMGALYDVSVLSLVVFSMLAQWLAIPLLFHLRQPYTQVKHKT